VPLEGGSHKLRMIIKIDSINKDDDARDLPLDEA
jgi:hypothetical protein